MLRYGTGRAGRAAMDAQVEYYTNQHIWKNQKTGKMPALYADDGKSGTNTKKRADLKCHHTGCPCRKDRHDPYKVGQQVCEEHGRLAGDHPKTEGKERGGGVRERGDQYTGGAKTGEILITILSSLAQEESCNISLVHSIF